MSTIIIASNRLPVKVLRDNNGTHLEPTDGGLASAVGSLMGTLDAKWVGCMEAQCTPEELEVAQTKGYYPVDLRPEVYDEYYTSFSNRVLWPVLHRFAPHVDPTACWEHYFRANQVFADRIAKLAQPSDIIWINDYHLFLVPSLLRARGLNNRIGFFLHTPFFNQPFFTHSHGREIMDSLAMADTIGVQTKRSLAELRAAFAQIGHKVNAAVEAFPIGIDFSAYNRRVAPVPVFYETLARSRCQTIFSLSRLDYTKGLIQALQAVTELVGGGQHAGEFVYRLQVVPSREHQPEYTKLKEQVEEIVERVNAMATTGWQPIEYTYGRLTPDELLLAYEQADIMLVTPVADGMNLVAKEFLAANSRGTLILSREAGAAEQLNEAILVDPLSPNEIAVALATALQTPTPHETAKRLRAIVRTEDVHHWARSFLTSLSSRSNV